MSDIANMTQEEMTKWFAVRAQKWSEYGERAVCALDRIVDAILETDDEELRAKTLSLIQEYCLDEVPFSEEREAGERIS